MRIATWNLDRAKTARKRADAQHCMAEIDADVWVLTETRDDFTPGAEYRAVAASDPRPDGKIVERWVTIWTRLPGGATRPTRDGEFTACAALASTPVGPLSVYGTVLPWRGSTWRGHPSAEARAFKEALSVQAEDWRELIAGGNLCVAGDFNQDLNERPFYWSLCAREHLKDALRSKLIAVTGGPDDPVSKLTNGKAACIDHICLSPNLAHTAKTSAWHPEREGRKISDHPGVVVTLVDL